MIKKAYNLNGQVHFEDSLNNCELPLLEERDFTQDKLDYPKISADKVVVDTARKTAVLNNKKTNKITELKSLIESELSALDHKVLPDYPYPTDQQDWITHRASLRADIASLSTKTIAELEGYVLPTRPF